LFGLSVYMLMRLCGWVGGGCRCWRASKEVWV
jgi:hypothetical protein